MLGWLCTAGLALIAGVAFWFFHPLTALWLALLSVLIYRLPAWGVSALFVTLSIDAVEPVWWGIQISFSELHLSAAVLAYLARQGDRPLDWRPVKWGVPFLAAVVLSAAVNIEWYKVLPHLIRASEWLAACFLTLNAFRENEPRKVARWALAGAAVFYCTAGYLQLPEVLAGRIFSFFNNPNQFAGYLALLFPFFVMFFFAARGRRVRSLWGYLALLTLCSTVATASRAALLSLVASIPILWWLHYRSSIQNFLHDPLRTAGRFLQRSGRTVLVHGLIAGLAVSLALWLGGFDPLARRVKTTLATYSKAGIVESMTGGRLPYFRLGLQIWQENWLLGVGPGRWEEAAETKLPTTQDWEVRYRRLFEKGARVHCHNLYIQLGSVLGMIGLLAFLFWIGRVFLGLATVTNAWTRAGTGLLIIFLIHNLVDVTFPSLGQELGCLIGLALAGSQEQHN